MKLPFTCLHVASPMNLSGVAAGRALLNALNEETSLVPDRYNNFEPIRKPYRGADLDTVLQSWTWPFLWTRKKPRSEGSVSPANVNHPRHSTLGIQVQDYKQVPTAELSHLLEAWAKTSSADIGLIHLFTEADKVRAKASGALRGLDRAGRLFAFSLPSHKIQICLPDFYWTMLFGKPYIDMFGREQLLSTPAHSVRELDGGHIIVQLTESLFDLEDDHCRVAAVRQRVMEHLGEDAFFSPGREVCRAPEFSFCQPSFG